MTDRVQTLLSTMKRRSHYSRRCYDSWDVSVETDGMDQFQLSTVFLKESLEKEQPGFLEGDIFGFVRYMAKRPGEQAAYANVLRGTVFAQRLGNIIPDYETLLRTGLDPILRQTEKLLPDAQGESLSFLTALQLQLQSVLDLCDRYREAAAAQGNTMLQNALARIPRKGAESFYEACLMQKILLFVLHCGNYKLIPLGRFDQYMLPYFLSDLKKGVSTDTLLETLELYFISLNLDSDLYNGEQQGDNGQSLVLGGYNEDGSDCFNVLSQLCLKASEELCLIDPKINIRVSSQTPESVYALGTRLTKKGLGFPQYLNDDVIIPGLMRLGYDPEDAYNYAVAACWEPIIPGCAMDVPNRAQFSYPAVITRVLNDKLLSCHDFDALMDAVEAGIHAQADQIIEACSGKQNFYFGIGMRVSPLLSMMIRGCMEKGLDLSSFCVKYHNSGSHGVGLSTAADSLAAVKRVIYEEKSVTPQQLLDALHADFHGFEALHHKLKGCSKMGNDDDTADSIAAALMTAFSQALNGRDNGVGGVWRAGTGSAQFYIRAALDCPATPDGRRSGEPFACSFSPAPHARVNGPLSVIRSFTKHNLTGLINGGPLTMELHHNVFRNHEGEQKVAQLARLFIRLGGHQLQLNAINKEQLLQAQKEPEKHRNLVVRVWGWSGYFCELDPEFQDHIIHRTDHSV